ncbi:RNA-directed DNA polymerase, eukaryota, reverse transcriptase zinc-binding domain protein [Tanacetum coccineum]|uniref:RNA-directed DNA polymerase, eukaryota, reverse transcriptase zinc-binding domain protein n=1 Tax=Tanacetum coccineum TaxID=301880 RepID=A0ABQ4WEU2_9ASTR
MKIDIHFPLIFKNKIGNGCDTRFWLDNWVGGPALKETFPRLFRLEANPSCLVSERAPLFHPLISVPTGIGPQQNIGHDTLNGLVFNWSWTRPIRTLTEFQELSDLHSLVVRLRLDLVPDTWECLADDTRDFSVKGMRAYISHKEHNPHSSDIPIRWNKILPLKINIFTWRTSHKRLPTRSNLDSRGIDLHSIRCSICDEAIESEEHLFVKCDVAKDTWKGVIDWWQINNITIATLEDVITLADTALVLGNLKIFFDVVVQTTL